MHTADGPVCFCRSSSRLDRSGASGLSVCIRVPDFSLGLTAPCDAPSLCAITTLAKLMRNPPGHFCLLKGSSGFCNTDCTIAVPKSKISVLSHNYLNTTISLGFCWFGWVVGFFFACLFGVLFPVCCCLIDDIPGGE